MAYFYRLIFGFYLTFALPLAASAALPLVGVGVHFEGRGHVGPVFSTPVEACTAFGRFFLDGGTGAPGVGGWSGSYCTVRNSDQSGSYGDYYPIWDGGRCPDNSVLIPGTDTCQCDPGFDEVGGQCKHSSTGNSCNGLSDFCSGLKGGKINLEGNGMVSPPGCSADSQRPNCAMGCAAEAVGMSVSYKTADGSWMTGQEYRVTGGTCTLPEPNDVPQKKESDCAGSVGEVNGVRTCVPNQAATGDTKTTEKQNSDGTSTSTESKTTCENGVCTTTTTTTNKDASGSTTSTSTSTSTSSQSTYCAENKTSAVCAATNGDKNPDGKDGSGKGKDGEEGDCKGEDCEDKPGKFEGSCAGGFTCEGDAINCAISKEIHTRNCQIDALKDSDLFKAWEGVKDFGTKNVTNDLPGNKRFDISVTDRDDFLSGGSCPPDRTIELGAIGSITLPFSELCPWLQMLGYVNIVFASVAGGLIIIRRQS